MNAGQLLQHQFFQQVTDAQDNDGIVVQNRYRVNFLTSQQSGDR